MNQIFLSAFVAGLAYSAALRASLRRLTPSEHPHMSPGCRHFVATSLVCSSYSSEANQGGIFMRGRYVRGQ